MKLYDIIIALAEIHIPFTKGGFSDGLWFDQKNKTIKNGKVVLFDKGKVVPQTLRLKHGIEIEISEETETMDPVENPYEELERRYKEFKYSVPNQYSSYIRNNFIAKDGNDLTQHQLIVGKDRQVARAELEAFVMFQKFPWQNEKHHYWQSQSDKDLILFREWSN